MFNNKRIQLQLFIPANLFNTSAAVLEGVRPADGAGPLVPGSHREPPVLPRLCLPVEGKRHYQVDASALQPADGQSTTSTKTIKNLFDASAVVLRPADGLSTTSTKTMTKRTRLLADV